jgi:hypothetical protein
MSYATVDDLAAKLKIRVTPENTAQLQGCLDAAAQEIDHYIDAPAGSPAVDPADPLAGQVNLARAVEWWKAADATFGTVGYVDVGSNVAPRPKDSFARHQFNLIALKQQWGVG